MGEQRQAVVVGALGMIGRYIVERLLRQEDWSVIGLSRRSADAAPRYRHVSVDLLDREDAAAKLAGLTEATHVFYAAFQPTAGDAAGYASNIAPNRDMLVNAVTAIDSASSALRRVVLVTGTKYYGSHLGPLEAIRAARDAAETALRDLQAAQASLVHAQKMAALGQLTAGIAHEIKNPLNFVNNFAGLSVELLDELKHAAAQAISALGADKRAEIFETIGMLTGNLEKIAEHGRRADGIVRGMLQHSRGSSGDWQATDLNALVEETLNLAYHGARAQDQNFNAALELDLDRNLAPIEVVPQDVSRVLLNLISNGFYAVTKRGREGDGAFRPTLKIATREFGDSVEVRVRDNGVGIPPEYCEKLFQPFFTTKPTGEGTGLGLSISYEIVTQQHGGTITVDSEVGDFTEFTVRLPRHRHAVAR